MMMYMYKVYLKYFYQHAIGYSQLEIRIIDKILESALVIREVITYKCRPTRRIRDKVQSHKCDFKNVPTNLWDF